MYIYFCSDYPAVVKLDGNIYKKIHTTVEQIAPITSTTFIEICPLSESERGFGFYLDEQFWQGEKKNVCVVDLKGGYLIKFKSNPICENIDVIFQHKTDYYSLSVFNDKGKKLSIETANDFYFENLSFDFDDVEIVFCERGALGLCFGSTNKTICVYNLENPIKKIFQKQAFYYSYSNRLVIKQKHLDVAKHEIISEWDFSSKSAVLVSETIQRCKDFHPGLLSNDVLPYAFLEELLIGGDVECYLHDKLKSAKDKLKGYLGDYLGICPPPPFRNPNEIGLIFYLRKNHYEVCYLTLDLEQGKIFNLKLEK